MLHIDRLATVGLLPPQGDHEAPNRLEMIRGVLEMLAEGQEATLTPAVRSFLLKEAEDYLNDLQMQLDMARSDNNANELAPRCRSRCH